MSDKGNSGGVKVVLLGDSGVGKTCIISRYISNLFEDNVKSTNGASYASKRVDYPKLKKSLILDIWDTAGQEKFKALTKFFYKDAAIVILVYDITRRDSFDNIKNVWYQEVKENGAKDIILGIAGNKYNMIVTDDFINSDDFKLSMINHKEKDTVNKAIRALVHLIPSLTEKILDKFEKFYEKEIEEVNELRIKNKEKENENENEEEEEEENEESEINDDNYPKLRIILLDFIDESIELFSSNKKKDILDFLIKVSDKEFDDSIFENINNTIFNLINSIPEKEIIENILSSIENSLTSIQEKNIDDININDVKFIIS